MKPLPLLIVTAWCLVSPTSGSAEPITAPLGGIGLIDSHDTQDLKVENPDRRCLQIKKPEDFSILQGDPSTRREVNLAKSNDPLHQVANIDIPEAGELLYHVDGIFCEEKRGDGAGKAKQPERWAAEYNRGGARILLEVNDEGQADNKVKFGKKGARLTVRVAGGPDNTTYNVRLTDSGVGDVAFERTPVSVRSDQAGGVAVLLDGTRLGNATITGTAVDEAGEEIDSRDVQPGSVTAEVIDFEVEIVDSSGATLRGDQTTVVGKRQSLKGLVVPAHPVTAHSWKIGGKIIKRQLLSMAIGAHYPLLPKDASQESVSFCWIEGSVPPGKVDVTYTATVYGMSHAVTVPFVVRRPGTKLSSVTTPLKPPVGIRDEKTILEDFTVIEIPHLVFGKNLPGDEGISCTGEVTTGTGDEGEIAFIQLVRSTRSVTRAPGYGGGTFTKSTNGNHFLDRATDDSDEDSPIVHFSGKLVPVRDNDAATITVRDTPGTALTGLLQASIDDDFRLFLMYRPHGADSVWVTLARLDWSWSGSAKLAGTWSMQPGQASSVAPGGADSTELPIWRGRVQDLEWTPVRP